MYDPQPRRFLIVDRDDPSFVMLEGIVWQDGTIGMHGHAVPRMAHPATAGLRAALGKDYSREIVNPSELDFGAASAWGSVVWLDKTPDEIEAAAAQAQADIVAAFEEARSDFQQIFFGARRSWGMVYAEPVYGEEDPDESIAEYTARRLREDAEEVEPEPDEDSENERFAPGTMVFAEPVFDGEEIVSVALTATPNDSGPIGVVIPDGTIATSGIVFADVQDEGPVRMPTTPITVEVPIHHLSTEAFNTIIGPVSCKNCGKPVEAVQRMGHPVWAHSDIGRSEFCSFRAEPDLPVRDDVEDGDPGPMRRNDQ